MNRNITKRWNAANSRARMGVANSDLWNRGASMATSLNQASQAAQPLNPGSSYAEGAQGQPDVGVCPGGGENRPENRAQQATVKPERPQESGGPLNHLSPKRNLPEIDRHESFGGARAADPARRVVRKCPSNYPRRRRWIFFLRTRP